MPVTEPGLRVEPAGRQRRRMRLPWVAAGVIVVAGAGLAAAVLAGSLAGRDAMLGLARPVERGDVLARQELTTVAVALDGQVPALPASAAADVVGRRVVASLPAGALVTPELLSGDAAVGDDERVVGLALDPGEYPVSGLRPGDVVTVVAAYRGGGDGPAAAQVLAETATVFAVEPVTEGLAQLLVSVTVRADQAAAVAGAAGADQVRLLLAGGAGS